MATKFLYGVRTTASANAWVQTGFTLQQAHDEADRLNQLGTIPGAVYVAARIDTGVRVDRPAVVKGFTTTILHARDNWNSKDVQLAVTNGRGAIVVSTRQEGEYLATHAGITPAQARELAADLVARADEIDANPLTAD